MFVLNITGYVSSHIINYNIQYLTETVLTIPDQEPINGKSFIKIANVSQHKTSRQVVFTPKLNSANYWHFSSTVCACNMVEVNES